MRVTFAQIAHAEKLVKAAIPKSDINSDKVIRGPDVRKIAQQKGNNKLTVAYAQHLDMLRRAATKMKGGSTPQNVEKARIDAEKRLKARDLDGNRAIDQSEMRSSMTGLEVSLLNLAVAAKGKTAKSLKLPKPYTAPPPRFSWRGTPDEVATSLLNAYSTAANDTKWTASPTEARSARFVVNGAEARVMVAELKKMHTSRQIAVMDALLQRSAASVYGCFCPTDAGKKVFEDYGRELGFEYDFGQPAAPRYHHS